MNFEGAFFDTNEYELTNKKIGEGAFGKVFIVEDSKDGEEYAAKIITCVEEFDSHDQMMFLRESMILHKLKHPSIVKFIGINLHSFDNPDKLEPTIITEYLKNGSLKEILKKEQNSIADDNWSPTKKYICLLGISDAMRYLHKHGILHRDLKPENILVDADYYPRVCDFGLSRCFSKNLSKSMQLSMTGKIGTPLYMAPEMMEDEDHYGPGIDVYAFAILAYEIVTGQEAFNEGGKKIKLGDLIKKVMSGGRPKFTEGVTDKMKELIEDCWSQDYKDRPSFDEIFQKLSSDFTYLYEDVDEDEIKNYLETLKEEAEEVAQVPSADEMNELENKNKELIIKSATQETENKKLKEEISQLKKDKETANNDIKKLKGELLGMKKEKEDSNKLKEEILQLMKDKEAANNNIKKLTEENNNLKKEKETANNNIKKLTEENNNLKKEKETANNEIKQMKKEMTIKTETVQSNKKKEISQNVTTKDESVQMKNSSKGTSVQKIPSDSEQSIEEVTTIVIDNGSFLMNAGFAGFNEPRSVFPSLVGRINDSHEGKYVGDDALSMYSLINNTQPIEHGRITRWDDIEELWKHIFSKELVMDPKEHGVFHIEPPIVEKKDLEKMIQIMFETFNVPYYYSINQEISQIFSSGRTEGIVLNLGYEFTRTTSFYDHDIIKESTKRIELGGKHISELLRNALILKASYSFINYSNQYHMDNIKRKVSYVALDYETEFRKTKSQYEMNYKLPGSNEVLISDERFRCPEVLFSPEQNRFKVESIQKLVFDSINKCDEKVRQVLFQNIVVAGGSSLIKGFPERFEKEIRSITPSSYDVNVIATPERKYAAWIGGSIVASLGTFPQLVVTHDHYNETGPGIVHHLPLF